VKKQLLIVIAGLALSTQPAFAGYYPWEMWQGSRALAAKDYAQAALRYQTALQAQPDSPQAHYNLGECLYREKKFPEAAQHFKKAMELSQTQLKGKAAYNLGNTLFREQKLEEALDAYKTALRWNEVDDDARYNIQVILDMLKKNQDPKKNQDKDKNKDNKDKNKDKDKDKDKGGQGNKGQDKDKSKNNDDKSQAKNDDNKGDGKDNKDKSKGDGKDDKNNQNQNKDKPKDDQQGQDQNQNGGQQPQGQNPQQSPNNGQQPQNSGQDPSGMSRQEAERMLRYFADQEKRKMQQGKGKKAGIVGLPSGETW